MAKRLEGIPQVDGTVRVRIVDGSRVLGSIDLSLRELDDFDRDLDNRLAARESAIEEGLKKAESAARAAAKLAAGSGAGTASRTAEIDAAKAAYDRLQADAKAAALAAVETVFEKNPELVKAAEGDLAATVAVANPPTEAPAEQPPKPAEPAPQLVIVLPPDAPPTSAPTADGSQT